MDRILLTTMAGLEEVAAMPAHIRLPHPSESLRTLLVVAVTLAMILLLFCSAPANSLLAGVAPI